MPPWKRTLDLMVCLVVLPVFAVLTLVVAIVMAISSPGPIFYTQWRVGLRGRTFRLYKFRTMHVGAPVSAHQNYFARMAHSNAPMQKLDAVGDTRLIRGGWILRACGIDELPQIINILRGDMTLVGPRPCLPYEYQLYTQDQRERFLSVPGLTGLWQVSGKNDTTFNEMIALDLEYSQRKSLAFDLRILAFTPRAVGHEIMQAWRARRRWRTQPGLPLGHNRVCPRPQTSDSRT